jgi:hypothetical protein
MVAFALPKGMLGILGLKGPKPVRRLSSLRGHAHDRQRKSLGARDQRANFQILLGGVGIAADRPNRAQARAADRRREAGIRSPA